MTEQTRDACHQTTLRSSLQKRISFLMTAGVVLLTLLLVTAVLGLILSAASDDAGVAAVRALAWILVITAGLVLVAILATLSKAVLLLLSGEELSDAVSVPPASSPLNESPER